VLGLVAGCVVLVLLLCAVLVPLALHSATTTRAAAAPAASPSPSPTPLSDSEYQQTLDTIDNQLKVSMNGLSEAREPETVGTLGTVLGDAAHQAAGTLEGITPPSPVELLNQGLVSALDGLADQAYGLGQASLLTQICTGSAGLARLTQSDAAQSTRQVVQELSDAGYTFGAFLPPSTPDGNRRLANGQLVKKASGGPGQLKIENKGSQDAMVTLAPVGYGTATVIMYVQAGQTATARGIRNGSYNLFVSGGSDWDSDLRTFTMGCRNYQFTDPLPYSSGGGKYEIWTITLGVGAGGNAPSSRVDPGSIPA